MEVKPTAELLRAISTLQVSPAPARPKASATQPPRAAAVQAPNAAKAAPGPAYRPGTFLDIFV